MGGITKKHKNANLINKNDSISHTTNSKDA
jgi:hypothetical protein